MSKVIRSVKNVTKGYSSVQVKVRNATSNDPWGPTGTEMSDIAQMTFNSSNDFYEIMDMLDKRLNDKGKNWRHVLKALKVLDYCLHEGSELVVTWARKNIYIIKTLREFIYVDEDGRDVGQNVRVSAKELTSLILDEERLRSERADRKTWKSRVTGIEEFGPSSSSHLPAASSSAPPSRRSNQKNRRTEEEDAEYRLAIEASKYEAEEDKKRREKNHQTVPDDADLEKAIKLSKEEEELRRRELEETNASLLFDDAPVQQPQSQFTGINQTYQQGAAVDWFANPMDQTPQPQQPQTTGFLNNVYSQPTGFPIQPTTGYQNGFGQNGQNVFQAQPSVFDQQLFQPQQPQQQQPFGQPQVSAFGNINNPYAQPTSPIGGLDQQQQQNTFLQVGAHNPWAQQQKQLPQAEALKPAPTGTNNPFASSFNRPQAQPDRMQSMPPMPSLSTLQEQKVQTQFNNHNFNPSTAFAPSLNTPQKEINSQHAHLNALLASGEGMDTFGNTGNLRIPAQHTAPGTFVNSAGQGLDRINQNATGNNPFFNQQFVPQSTGFATQQGGRMMPAATGPASMNGFGGSAFGGSANNPFGHQTQQSHQQQQQQGGSLIDL